MRMRQLRLQGDGGRCGNRNTQICFEKEGGGDSIGELEMEMAWPCSLIWESSTLPARQIKKVGL